MKQQKQTNKQKKLQENFSPKTYFIYKCISAFKFEMNYVSTGIFLPQCGITTFNLIHTPNVPNETYDHIYAHILEWMEEGINGHGLSQGDDGGLMQGGGAGSSSGDGGGGSGSWLRHGGGLMQGGGEGGLMQGGGSS